MKVSMEFTKTDGDLRVVIFEIHEGDARRGMLAEWSETPLRSVLDIGEAPDLKTLESWLKKLYGKDDHLEWRTYYKNTPTNFKNALAAAKIEHFG